MNTLPRFSALNILLIIIIISTAILVTLKLNQPHKQTNNLDPKIVQTPTNQNDVPEIYNCSGEYINDTYNFSINCPQGWKLTVFENGKAYKNDGTNPLDDEDLAFFKLVSQDQTITFNFSISENNEYGHMEEPADSITELPGMNVAGIPSKKFSSTGPGSVTITVVTKTNNVTYTFIMDDKYWDKDEKAKADKIYSDLLGSFTIR